MIWKRQPVHGVITISFFRINGEEYPSIVRIVAKEEDTDIYRDGKKISEIKTSGGIIGKGFQEFRLGPMISFQNQNRIISGDKPIKVSVV